MAGNTLGQIFRVTTFGESHGECVGVVVDGCPAGVSIDLDFIQNELNRRRPGQSEISTQRREADAVHFVSGIFEGKTTGAPVCAWIKNQDQRSSDYDHLKDQFRPSHADYTYTAKYGHRDHRGGGRSSARETAARVIAGGIAKLLLQEFKIEVKAFVSQVGPVSMEASFAELDWSQVERSPVRCPDLAIAERMIQVIENVKSEGDTVGGVITCLIQGCPPGLGEPVFDRLHADLGKAMLSINAVKGFEIGSGFRSASLRGSEHNDPFVRENEKWKTLTNHSGGIQGGISNGMDIYFRVAFKPVATLAKLGPGRHDPCVVPRAVPIVESMAAITLADHFLRNRSARL